MKKLIMLIVSSCFIFSCAKEVNTKSKDLTIPTVTTTNPYITIPNAGTLFSINFANHATVQDDEDMLSVAKIPYAVSFDLPQVISTISFLNSSKPNLSLYRNNVVVCTYIWNVNQYQARQDCNLRLNLTQNDTLHVNVPRSQTASLSFLVL